MAQCNIVTGICGCLAVLSFILAAYNYVELSTYDANWEWFSYRTSSAFGFNTTQVEKVYGFERVEPDDEMQVYYVKVDDVDCQSTAAAIEVTFSCLPANDARNGKVKDLKAACQERDNSQTGVTMMKVVTWAPYGDEDNGTLVEGNYTVVAPVPIFVYDSWGWRLGDSFFSRMAVVYAILFVACGVVCGCSGLVAYACWATPVTQPQAQFQMVAPQMQAQPLQQPMYGQQVANPANGQGQYGQYGQYGVQPVNPASGQYGHYGAQPMNPAYGQGQP